MKQVDCQEIFNFIEKLAEQDKGLTKLVQEKLLGKGHVQIVNSVRDIEEKFQDILLLKKNVQIISSLFEEMTKIVNEQNEAMDIIEEQTNSAKNKLKEGNKNLEEAKIYLEKERTNKCCFLMWLIMSFSAILIPIILAILNSNRIF